MDCPNYLKQLDAVSIGSEDHEDPGVREAVAHLSECDGCSREFQVRREFDRQVATRLRDVAVPAEARERLLLRLNQADSPESALAAPATGGFSWASGVLPALLTTAAVVIVGVVWYFNRPSHSSMTMDEIDDAVAEQFADVTFDQYGGLDEFDGSFEATIDDGRWKRVTNSNPRGVDLNNDGDHDAAIYWIDRPVAGVLLVLSPGLATDAPTTVTSARGAAPKYSPVRVAWLPGGGEKVHLCVLNSAADDGDLQRLLAYVIDSMTA